MKPPALNHSLIEVALVSVFPDGIERKDYGRAADLIANLTVSMLANGYKPKKEPQAREAPPGPPKKKGPDQEALRAMLLKGNVTAKDAVRHAGYKPNSVFLAVRTLNARRVSRGVYTLVPEAS